MREAAGPESTKDYLVAGDVGKEYGVTILVINYNRRPSIPRLLRSALDAVHYFVEAGIDAEILVIDSDSRDGSQKLLRSIQVLYDEPRLDVAYLEEYLDAAALRNLALRMSRFRYMCRLYAGDELVPENMQILLKSIRNTGAALAYGNLIELRGDEVVGAGSNTTFAPSQPEASHADGFCILDAQRLLKLGGYVNCHPEVKEDWEMILHLEAEEELVLFVPVVLGYRHLSVNSEDHESELSEEGAETLKKVYAFASTRDWNSIRIGRIYHPGVGFVDEW